ncbi:C39 family peptidase [Kutzneria sp. CA-103260]|uniref:C39 family peptidase n=1 Tax=Kutzneria sp. CA-103260 TaxID=2802641 RepID=UPI001BA97BE8|nr:C39 family peptidase [Kutzneria sp. CA-103260]
MVRTQYQSPDLIDAIAYDGADPATDPLWHLSGAASRAEYGRWCRHCCGMACLQMVLEHRDGQAPTLFALLRGCTAAGGYVEQPDGGIAGLLYRPFVDYVRATYGIFAQVCPDLTMDGIRDELNQGRLVMASVHKEIRRPDREAPGRGGHLVLVTGHDRELIHFRNPSGHSDAARYGVLAAQTFATFFAGRGVSMSLRAQP